ncbi:FRAS1-related extracellular matrix protein 1 [Labeo rohita]|uniref:FRAS1-related extracellular matrix protein 1 n=1 Tax=Labeo rohita TaxID=84645 RepID=A0ABQ8MIP3_LABRO|nr:FRAS1-related extracellular matrix protein 1 [Labeo rohita]
MTAKHRTCLSFLLLGLVQQIQGSLVKTNLGLKVKRGQSVYLQEEDLQFHIPRARDACKLEVVLNEPITQRVGTLSPQVFDCHFLADEVKYTHNGCPILKEDTVKLRLYRFTETETYSELFSLRVEIMEPDCNVIKFGSQNLEVPEFYGLSNVLDGNVVSFHYEHRHNIECTVRLTTLETHLPVHGQLVTGEPEKPEGPRGDEPDSFVSLRRQLDNKARANCKSDDCLKGLKLLKITKVPCNDFLLMGIRYQHIDPPSPDIDYIAIRLDLTDTRSRSIIQSEQAWIPVTIKDAMPNQPPKPAFMSMFILEVDQFILTPLSTATLDAEDDETPKQRLVEFEVHDFYFEKSQPVIVHVSIRTADTNAPRVSWNMGGKGFMFTVNDIKDSAVRYHHDDSDTTKDYIVFRITDGLHQTRHKFPINILPKDDSPPFLITNMVLELAEGQTALLRGSILQACDMDSSDDYIMFNITRPPQAGEIMKMPGPGNTGSEVFDDSFEVVIVIQIQPVPDQPPQEAPGVTRHLVVNETDVIYLTKQQLHFVDLESPDSELTYTVTTPPFYTTTYGDSDAGRLFLVDSIPKFTKDPNAPMLRLFTQHAVNYMKVAYMPPIVDIGPYPQHIQFVLSVTNQQGSTTTGICFNVTILPVDNLPPEVHVKPLTVDEGGESCVSEDHMRLSDKDSLQDSLHVELKTGPQHGSIYLDGTPMSPGQTFTVRELKSLKVRYRHDSSETEHDDIKFIVTDGINIADFVLHVKVTLVNDEVPVLVPGLKPILVCAEGQEVQITIEYICATDPDSDDSTLIYMIARQPYHGVVQRNGIIVDRFIQADVTAGLISYRHTGQEIGLQPRHDVITFVISDGESGLFPSCCGDRVTIFNAQTPEVQNALPVYDLNITVYPVNNQPPSIAVGEVFMVDEGGSASITVTHLRVEDQDSAPEDLNFILVAPPQFGYIENVLPSPGFEKSNMGISIASFTYRDVLNGHINYVQSRHQRMEPTTDQLMLHVREGDMKELDPSIISAVDLDVPRDRLMFSIVQRPQHGSIMSVPHGNDLTHYKRGSEIPVEHFTMDNLRNGMSLMYMHDGSESEQDGFIVQLSDGKHQLQKHVRVKVLPVNDEEPQIVRNTGLEMEAGESRLISSAVLSAHDKDTPSSDIIYVFESVPSHGFGYEPVTLPSHGSSWSSCSRLLCLPPIGWQEPLSCTALSHHRDIALCLKPVRTSRGERVILTTDVLLAVDGTDKPEELLYVITAPPAHGYVEYIKHTGVQIQSFSQLDVAANLVCYVHDNRATSPKETLQFIVSNGISTRNGTLEIFVEMTDKVLPTLVRNTGLWVPQGSTMTLTSDVLFLSDPDSPHTALSYRVLQPPQYGQLLLKGQSLVTGRNFTQQNIQDLDVAYRHSGGASQIDRFKFTASDSTKRGFLLDGKVQTEPVFFTLQMAVLETLWKVEILKDGRYGIFISSRELKAQDLNSADRDLNRRNIVYIINCAQDTLTDSLEFAVSDALGNTGASHKLEFSWASVQLTRTEYVICESQGSVALTIQRKGNVQDSSYVTVQVKELTASAGKDFIPASSLIQFDPGMVSRVWKVEIVQDSLEEADEKFEVSLVSPVAAVLKDNSKATIFIKDTNGQCRKNRFEADTGLRGEEVQPGPYPQHGSIQVEMLPFSQGHIRGDGSDVIYKYHGIMSMAVEEDSADSRSDRKAQVQVTSWGQQRSPHERTKPQQTVPHTNTRLLQHLVTQPSSKPCTPELTGFLHYNESTAQLFRCNGDTWRPWTPTNETVKAQKCPQAWTYHNNYCYILSTERKATWSAAARACRESYNGNLVSVLSKGDMDWLWDFSERKPFWIGLNDRDNKSRWEWVGGEPVTYTNWRRSPPKNRKGTRRCVLVWRKTKWQIRDCKNGKGHRYIKIPLSHLYTQNKALFSVLPSSLQNIITQDKMYNLFCSKHEKKTYLDEKAVERSLVQSAVNVRDLLSEKAVFIQSFHCHWIPFSSGFITGNVN